MVPDRVSAGVRRALLCLAGSEALYFFAVFVTQTLLHMQTFYWIQQGIERFSTVVIMPWGMALCLLRLDHSARNPHASSRADLTTLFILLAWIVIPFALRFGLSFNNLYSWYNHTVVFFGLYALLSEATPERRARTLDCVAALFAVLSFAMTVPALYGVFTASQFTVGSALPDYGVNSMDLLQLSMDNNSSAMCMMGCALLPLIGFCRRKRLAAKLLHLIPSVLAMLTIVFTQSRTSRYALAIVLALGCYGLLCTRLRLRYRVLRHAVALLAAGAVLVGVYGGARILTDAALAHYANVRTKATLSEAGNGYGLAAALAEEAEAPSAVPQEAEAAASSQRAAVDSTFSERTEIWNNLFALWKEEPVHLIIGNGMGRTGSRIVQGTIHEEAGAVAVHNTYLQFIADYGLIGFALMALFLCRMAGPCVRVFFAPAETAQPGDRVLCMLVVAELLTGMMESQPLSAMSLSNMLLFFALGTIYSRDAAIRRQRSVLEFSGC